MLLALSTSGNSAKRAGRGRGGARREDMTVVALTGRGGGKSADLLRETDVHICVPHERAARIQEVHIAGAALPVRRVDLQLLGEQESADDDESAAPMRRHAGGPAARARSRAAPRWWWAVRAGAAMVVIDRRSSGVQLEDESIEISAASRISETFGDSGHVNVTSYNRPCC